MKVALWILTPRGVCICYAVCSTFVRAETLKSGVLKNSPFLLIDTLLTNIKGKKWGWGVVRFVRFKFFIIWFIKYSA